MKPIDRLLITILALILAVGLVILSVSERAPAVKKGNTSLTEQSIDYSTIQNERPAISEANTKASEHTVSEIGGVVAEVYKEIIERSQLAAKSTDAITDNFSKDEYAQLLAILAKHAKYCHGTSECRVGDFRLTPVILDGDGKQQFIVQHDEYCGSGGCTTLLMSEGTKHVWKRLAGVFGYISVEPTSTHGKKDIKFSLKVYRDKGGWYMVDKKYSWSGQEYIISAN